MKKNLYAWDKTLEKKHYIFTIKIEKEVTRINENGEKIVKVVPYILQFIDSTRFMASSLSVPVINFSKGIHKTKCKYRHSNKIYETCGITYEWCNWFLECTEFQDDLIEIKCLCCNTNYHKRFDEENEGQLLKTNDILVHTNFVTTVVIILLFWVRVSALFCCSE